MDTHNLALVAHPTLPTPIGSRQGKMTQPSVLALGLALALVAACCVRGASAAFGFGDYRIDFDFLGGEGDLRPEQ